MIPEAMKARLPLSSHCVQSCCQGSTDEQRHWNVQTVRGFLRKAYMVRECMAL